MNKLINISFLVLVILSTGCQEVFQPEVDNVDPYLIVEAEITTVPGKHYVYLRTSSDFSHHPVYRSVDGAIVYVEDQDGNRQYFNRVRNGIYESREEDGFAAEIGGTYQLFITLNDGTEYASTEQTVVESPEIKSLYCQYNREFQLSENVYGEVSEIGYDGIEVFADAKGVLDANNYYFYKWKAYEQHFSLMSIPPNDYYLYSYRPLNAKYSYIISLGNADDFGNKVILNNKMLFISSLDMYQYFPPVPDSMEEYVVSTAFQGLLFRLEQYSLTPDAYSFWSDAREQLEAGGKLFDPVTPELHGNIKCTSDSLKSVIGIFTVSDRTDKYAYLHIKKSNEVRYFDIDTFPEIFLDSISYSMPEGWIRPPY